MSFRVKYEEREWLLERERQRIIKAKAAADPCPDACPSPAGYMAHRRAGTKSCAASRNAWRDYYRERRKK